MPAKCEEAYNIRRSQILDEAAKVFAEWGYARAKVDDIAGNLGIAKGTVYRYFSSKEEMFLATADGAMSRLQTQILSAMADIRDPFAQILAGVKASLEFFDNNLHVIEIFIHERAEFRNRKTPTCLVYRDETLRVLEGILEEWKRQRKVRDIDVKTTAGMMGDLLYGTVYTHFLRGRPRKLARFAPQIVDLFLAGILTFEGRRQYAKRRPQLKGKL